MKNTNYFLILISIISIFLCATTYSNAGEVRIAVASNFTNTAKEIGKSYENETGNKVHYSFGSTGQLYAQITQHAPYDIFLAADQLRPSKTTTTGFGVSTTQFTYANGKIALYSEDKHTLNKIKDKVLDDISRFAIANPLLAPYGVAAEQAMHAMDIHGALSKKIIKGNNIAQTFQFIQTRNTEAGIVSLNQVMKLNSNQYWIIPPEYYAPIKQDAILLTRAKENDAAISFMDYLKSNKAKEIIKRHGYGI